LARNFSLKAILYINDHMREGRKGLAFMEKKVPAAQRPDNRNQMPLLYAIEARPRAEAVNRIRAIVTKEIFEGDGMEAVDAKLNATERAVLDVYVLAEDRPTLKQAAKRLEMPKGTVSSAVTSIRYKLAGRYVPPEQNFRKRQSERARRIMDVLEQKKNEGETSDQIMSRFSEIEKQVLDLYVLSSENLTQWEVAERLEIPRSTVASALARVEEKLNIKTVQLQMPF
jgi:DNA-directed RNA polymerase specialized sigma subunit